MAGIDVGYAEVGFWAFAAAAYSNDAPYLDNAGTDQTMLSPAWIHPENDPSKDVLSWVFDEKVDATTLRARYPTAAADFLQSVNSEMFGPIVSAAQSGALMCYPPFVTPEIEHLCEAARRNSPVSAWDQVHHPVQYCHSPDDDIVPRLMTDAFLVGAITGAGGTAMEYQAPLDYLKPRGSHTFGQMFCNAAVPTFLSQTSAFLEVEPIEMGNYYQDDGWGLRGGYKSEQVTCPPHA